MTFTIDPNFIWQLILMAFVAGGAWASLHLRVRWLERRQDVRIDELKKESNLKIEQLKKTFEAEMETLREAHNELKQQHVELKGKVESKGESLTTVVEQLKQVEKRLEERIDLKFQMVVQMFKGERVESKPTTPRKRTRRPSPARSPVMAQA